MDYWLLSSFSAFFHYYLALNDFVAINKGYEGYFQPCRLSPGACYFEDPILHGIVVHGNNNNLDCTNSILRSYLPSTGSKYCKPEKIDELEYKAKESLVGKNSDERGPKMYEYKGSNSLLAGCNMRSSPIPVASSLGSYGSSGRDLYYRSARSLSTSPMSTIGSCAANIQHPCRTSSEMPLLTEDGDSSLVPLLGSLSSSHAARPLGIKNTRCVVSSAASFVGLYVLQLSVNGVFDANLIPVGRKLLQHEALESFHGEHVGSGGIGSFLGWAMAGI